VTFSRDGGSLLRPASATSCSLLKPMSPCCSPGDAPICRRVTRRLSDRERGGVVLARCGSAGSGFEGCRARPFISRARAQPAPAAFSERQPQRCSPQRCSPQRWLPAAWCGRSQRGARARGRGLARAATRSAWSPTSGWLCPCKHSLGTVAAARDPGDRWREWVLPPPARRARPFLRGR
jgi:hypothetical protein